MGSRQGACTKRFGLRSGSLPSVAPIKPAAKIEQFPHIISVMYGKFAYQR